MYRDHKLLHIHNLPEDYPKKLVCYLGIDPTGPGIHIGHLIPLILGLKMLKEGHELILLIGGFTGGVGDPTDKNQQRQKLDNEYIEENSKHIEEDLKNLFKDYKDKIKVVNNAHWLGKMALTEYLQIGYSISVNRKLHMDTFKRRIETHSHLSMCEFAYSDLQMIDFLHLYREYNCNTQIGGGDQWGNIAFGIDCVKKITGDNNIFGICVPLLTSGGKKVSKSEGKPPYIRDPQLVYDFILNIPDETAVELFELLIEHKCKPSDPRELKHELIKHIIFLYHHDENLYSKIHEENQKRFYASTEEQEEFLPYKTDKLLNILNNITELSLSDLKRNLKGNAIRVNDQVQEESIMLSPGKYKISLGKKQHFFVEITE